MDDNENAGVRMEMDPVTPNVGIRRRRRGNSIGSVRELPVPPSQPTTDSIEVSKMWYCVTNRLKPNYRGITKVIGR